MAKTFRKQPVTAPETATEPDDGLFPDSMGASPFVPEDPNTHAQYIRKLYQSLLNRPPESDATTQMWVDWLRKVGSERVVQAIGSSPEGVEAARQRAIRMAYLDVLGRVGSQGEVESWSKTGFTPEMIRQLFHATQEYFDRLGPEPGPGPGPGPEPGPPPL